MLAIKRIVKYLISKLLSLNFLERLSQNKIWREIIEQKKPEIVSSVNGILKELWDNRQPNGFISKKDILANISGIILGVFIIKV